MTGKQLTSPFGDQPVEEIHLDRAPLAKVLAQIKFPGLSMLREESVVNSFVSFLDREYPLVQERRGLNLVITPEGVTQQASSQRIWSVRSRDESRTVSITDNFLSLETVNYQTRGEFIMQFEKALKTLFDIIEPPYCERIGMRYINRITDQELINSRLAGMIRPEMLGGLALRRSEGTNLKHSMLDALFADGEYAIQVRCGMLPANSTLDADIPALPDPVWILDIDSYIERRMAGPAVEFSERLWALADRAYRMFRWIVNDEFIEHFREGSDD
jgi:uncharacterized protein (TIGR04255 family)